MTECDIIVSEKPYKDSLLGAFSSRIWLDEFYGVLKKSDVYTLNRRLLLTCETPPRRGFRYPVKQHTQLKGVLDMTLYDVFAVKATYESEASIVAYNTEPDERVQK